jgi:hypothetical protein
MKMEYKEVGEFEKQEQIRKKKMKRERSSGFWTESYGNYNVKYAYQGCATQFW